MKRTGKGLNVEAHMSGEWSLLLFGQMEIEYNLVCERQVLEMTAMVRVWKEFCFSAAHYMNGLSAQKDNGFLTCRHHRG